MKIIEMNFAGETPPRVLADEYEKCNFAQSEPLDVAGEKFGIEIFPDNVPRVFKNCNLMNCKVPDGSVIIDCNTAILEVLVESTDDIIVDGQIITGTSNKITRQYGMYQDGVRIPYVTPQDGPA
jgi:hypothetical protein